METKTDTPIPSETFRYGAGRKVVTLLMCLCIIAVGVLGAVYIGKGTPKARKQPPSKMTPLVQVQTVYPETHRLMVRAMGTVVPSRVMTLKSRVAGEVISMAPEFTEGGLVQSGETLVQLDPADYRLALARKRSAVSEAEYQLKVEMGRQAVAKREWELLGGDKKADALNLELALRKPHLIKAEADLAAAKADLEQATLDMERTRIQAPFNAIVREKSVEIGSEVPAHGTLAELVGTDEYHVRVSLPADRLQWIGIPGFNDRSGAEVQVLYRNGFQRTGTVVKLLSDLETEGRMARVLVAVQDPLGLGSPEPSGQMPLLIGEYVRVEIMGQAVDAVYRIPRTALRDDTHIWVAGTDETLKIQEVDTVWRDPETVLIRKGLAPGDRVIVSNLAAPIHGMPVKIEPDPAGDSTPDPPAETPPVQTQRAS